MRLQWCAARTSFTKAGVALNCRAHVFKSNARLKANKCVHVEAKNYRKRAGTREGQCAYLAKSESNKLSNARYVHR